MNTPPTRMPCPVCGKPCRINGLGTHMLDDDLNIYEAVIRCDEHGEARWIPANESTPVAGRKRRWRPRARLTRFSGVQY